MVDKSEWPTCQADGCSRKYNPKGQPNKKYCKYSCGRAMALKHEYEKRITHAEKARRYDRLMEQLGKDNAKCVELGLVYQMSPIVIPPRPTRDK